jgi:hypothetical protein
VIAIVGAGAAGLAAAIFAARRGASEPIVLFEGARRPGAKILVSGGSRCNVTNAVVRESDFGGGPRHLVRRVLRSFDVTRTIAFFREIGVPLREEADGKLFPEANRSRVVLDALLAEASRLGVTLRAGERVADVDRGGPLGFVVTSARGPSHARAVLLATGGLALPKSGSDGHGLRMAQALGHSLVPTTPALVPLRLEGQLHAGLSGVSQPAELSVSSRGRVLVRRRGALLWTHFGVSGPVVLDVSRDWLRAKVEGAEPVLEANLLPGSTLEQAEGELLALARESPRLSLVRALGRRLPAALAEAVAEEQGIGAERPLGTLRRDERRACLRALVHRTLPVSDARGYESAEATAGGVPLGEVDTRTLESRRCPGLFLAGEILDVDGRLGGFNFQWAWSSAWVAAGGLVGRARAGLC